METIISIAFALAALLMAPRAKKITTKTIGIALAISSLLYLDPLFGLGEYGNYIFVFTSILASVEPFNSLNLKDRHKYYFLSMGLAILLNSLVHFLDLPFNVAFWPIGILFLLFSLYFRWKDNWRMKSRYTYMLIWCGASLNWVISAL